MSEPSLSTSPLVTALQTTRWYSRSHNSRLSAVRIFPRVDLGPTSQSGVAASAAHVAHGHQQALQNPTPATTEPTPKYSICISPPLQNASPMRWRVFVQGWLGSRGERSPRSEPRTANERPRRGLRGHEGACDRCERHEHIHQAPCLGIGLIRTRHRGEYREQQGGIQR